MHSVQDDLIHLIIIRISTQEKLKPDQKQNVAFNHNIIKPHMSFILCWTYVLVSY